MASISSLCSGLKSVPNLLRKSADFLGFQCQQIRTKYANNWQKRDQKRRVCVKNHGLERQRLNTVYRCSLLPPELRKKAHEEVVALPRDSNYIRLRNRCYVTSRPRGPIHEFRVSRIVFRHLADYNKLSGVKRAQW